MFYFYIFFYFFFITVCYGNGVGAHTLVTTNKFFTCIHQLHSNPGFQKLKILGRDVENGTTIWQKLTAVARGTCNIHAHIIFDGSKDKELLCTPNQQFYVPARNRWIPAQNLYVGDKVLAKVGLKKVKTIYFCEKQLEIFAIEVKKSHTFYVGKDQILTHNMTLPYVWAGIEWAFGSWGAAGAATGSLFGPVTMTAGCVIAGAIGVGIHCLTHARKNVEDYKLCFDINTIKKHRIHACMRSPSDRKPLMLPVDQKDGSIFPVPYNVRGDFVSPSTSFLGENAEVKPPCWCGHACIQTNCCQCACGCCSSQQKLRISPGDLKHIFRQQEGHFPIDNPQNRNILLEMASNSQNFLGFDQYGTEWFAQNLADGTQLWAGVRNGKLRYGGLNKIPKTFNPKTGLSSITKR